MRIVIWPPDSIRLLVNRQYALPGSYIPADLVIPAVPNLHAGAVEACFLRTAASGPLEKLIEAVKQATGVTLYARSGYRSYRTQQQIFEKRACERGAEAANLTTAKPGESEHQTGLAMDVTSRNVNFELHEQFGTTDEGRWLGDHAHQFGFIIRYPAGSEPVTGYLYEPWHLRFVGEELAAALIEMRLTMEEYFEKQTDRDNRS